MLHLTLGWQHSPVARVIRREKQTLYYEPDKQMFKQSAAVWQVWHTPFIISVACHVNIFLKRYQDTNTADTDTSWTKDIHGRKGCQNFKPLVGSHSIHITSAWCDSMEQGWQNPSGLLISSPGWEHASVSSFIKPWQSRRTFPSSPLSSSTDESFFSQPRLTTFI